MNKIIQLAWVVLGVEFAKLRRTLALVLVVAAPALIAAFSISNQLRADRPVDWTVWLNGAMSIWAFFLLPMSLAALTALVANMEHSTRMWDHLRALPIPRWTIYGAKAATVAILLLCMTLAVPTLTGLAVTIGGKMQPAAAATGVIPFAEIASAATKLFLSSILLAGIQLWVALRFASFVPAIAIGIGGTFFAVVAASAEIGVYSPWQIPLNAIGSDPERAGLAIALGAAGGVILMVVMVIHLARREVI